MTKAEKETPKKSTANLPQAKIEYRDPRNLKPNKRNARTHSDDQVEEIAKSIDEFGFVGAVLIDAKGGIIAGHGRTMAAIKRGMKRVPVIVARGWNKNQIRAYMLADNKIALNAGWDASILALELGELKLEGVDLALTGFDKKELARLMPSQNIGGGSGGGSDDNEPIYQILIECADEGEQTVLVDKLIKDGLKVRALIA